MSKDTFEKVAITTLLVGFVVALAGVAADFGPISGLALAPSFVMTLIGIWRS